MSLVGVKYTTARWAAEQAVDAVVSELGGRHGACRTGNFPLPHAGIADVEGRLVEMQRALQHALEPDVAEHLASWYGTEAPDVLEHAVAQGRAERLGAATPVLAGEIGYAIATGSAVRLTDVVLRRTPLGAAGHPGRAALERAGGIMAAAYGWTPERLAEEIALVEARFDGRPTAP